MVSESRCAASKSGESGPQVVELAFSCVSILAEYLACVTQTYISDRKNGAPRRNIWPDAGTVASVTRVVRRLATMKNDASVSF